MTEQRKDHSITQTLLELRATYWTKRLDHTLTHTQTSSKLIYLIDGAVLAFVYFAIEEFRAARYVVFFAAIPMLLLSLLNAMHALLIRKQRWWYNEIDTKLQTLLAVEPVAHEKDNGRKFWESTHGLYELMHWFICATLLTMAALCFFMVAVVFQTFRAQTRRG